MARVMALKIRFDAIGADDPIIAQFVRDNLRADALARRLMEPPEEDLEHEESHDDGDPEQ